ncbi:hypothetical protein PRIPAC_77534, partial [Pristionchus pacificus]
SPPAAMATCVLLSLLLFAFIIFESGNAHKILVYNSKFGHSHSNYLGRISDILADAGHNVTSLIPIMDGTIADGTTKSHVIHVQPDPRVAQLYLNPEETNFLEMNMMHPIVPFIVGPMFTTIFGLTCQRVLDEPGLIERLREEKFDVYITENFDVCGIGLAKIIDAKAVIGSTTTCLFGLQFDEFGIEPAYSYRPSMFADSLVVNSFVSRFWNFLGEMHTRFTFSYARRTVNKVLQDKFGQSYPTIAEQSSNVIYVLTNSEPLIESAGPTSSRVIDIPGIGAITPKPLDKYWEKILNRRAKAVLLSFGSMAKSMLLSKANKAGILHAISQFPDITFIWKYEEPEDEFCKTEASKLNNLVLTKWMPQVDILNHKNLVLFITHGGMGSTQETALRGVPGIFIPIFGDQPRNSGMMQFNGLGLVYDKFELHDGKKLASTIREVLENNK